MSNLLHLCLYPLDPLLKLLYLLTHLILSDVAPGDSEYLALDLLSDPLPDLLDLPP
jgi:hypothetical protein